MIPPKASAAQSSALDSTTPMLWSSVFQRSTLRSYSESRTFWRASLLVNTATPVHPNPFQPSTGFYLNGESTSRSPSSLTNFFRLFNRPTWPQQSLYMPWSLMLWSLIQVKRPRLTLRSHQACNWRARFPFRSSFRLESPTGWHQTLSIQLFRKKTKNPLHPSRL